MSVNVCYFFLTNTFIIIIIIVCMFNTSVVLDYSLHFYQFTNTDFLTRQT